MEDTLNVLVTVDFSDEIMDRLKLVSPRYKFTRKLVKSASDISRDVWAATDILYTTRTLPEPDVALRLRWIQTHMAGVDSILDHPIFNNDVILTTTSGIHASTMAEFCFAMILAFARKIPLMLRNQAKAEWPDDRLNTFLPRELRFSTIGIIGYGSIGRAVARIAKVFGMEVLASKRNVKNPASVNEYEEPGIGDPAGELVDRLYPPEAIKSMVAACDFVLVALPLVPDTTRIINADVFAAMKKTAYFINVGRGALVDEEAMIRALQTGQIAGAGLDVFVQEPLPASSPLWGMPNVIISPHTSGNTSHYNESAAEVFLENLGRYIEKRELLNRVDLKIGY
jgi:phosphoglycerate dehydrogenase-like enzyme